MHHRWMESLYQNKVPSIDIDEKLFEEEKNERSGQFAPEYSQAAYLNTFAIQEVVGDYTNLKDGVFLQITAKQREGIVALISQLHKKKSYRPETLFIAVGLLDKYLKRVVT